MNYYPFNLGDYAAHTAHLEPMEDLAYRRLLDQYYMREGPLPADTQVTAKLVRMRSMISDVESVLNEFFTLTDSGWVHMRCEHEICHMQEKQAKARTSAAASVKSRQTSAGDKGNGRSTSVDIPSTDVELPTPTPTPIKKTKNTAPSVAPPDGVSESVWIDFCKVRKAKRAELTQTEIDNIRTEAVKAGWTLEAALIECCSRGWIGFKAIWVADKATSNASPVSFKASDKAEGIKRWEQQTGRTHPDNKSTVIDITPRMELTA